MTFRYRPITREEFPAYLHCAALAFGFEPKDEDLTFGDFMEYDRTVAAFDGDDIVGTLGAITFGMFVPGGRALPAPGVTFVSVRPTHRRRGILSELMRRHFAQCRERAEPLSTLYASEATIYGRFGYGHAVPLRQIEIERRHAGFSRTPDWAGVVDYVTAEEFARFAPAFYASLQPRTGMMTRDERRWKERLFDPEPWRDGHTARRFAAYREDGEVLGYVAYRAKEKWDDDQAMSEIRVVELLAATPAAYAALWHFVCNHDLMAKIGAYNRPVDEPLPWLLADPRRLRQKVQEGLWLRLVDVPAALEGRGYRTPDALAIEVDDPFCPWNEGVYRLEVAASGGKCDRVDVKPDVRIRAADLAALYTGRRLAHTLHFAGRMEGGDEAVARLDAMFATAQPPWCAEQF